MRKYEVMYIVRTDIDEEATKAVVEKFANIIGNGGEISETNVMGKRRLAYEINKFRDGYYVLVHFSAPAEVITELDRVMKISDEIVRYLIVKEAA
jgi:small subunit ribosomal protein S6